MTNNMERWTFEVEKARKCDCKFCGEKITANDGEKVRFWLPKQKRGANAHVDCWNTREYVREVEETTSIGNSKNCHKHTMRVENVESTVVFAWLCEYGFEKVNFTTVERAFENAESIGSMIANIFENGCTVFVDGNRVGSISEYDRVTKEICMR